MKADRFRALALELPETEEGAHMGHPDFRVGGKVFASLGPREAFGMVRVTPAEQALLVSEAPDAFVPLNGAWGRAGGTKVVLEAARVAPLRRALLAAWRNLAPERVRRRHLDD